MNNRFKIFFRRTLISILFLVTCSFFLGELSASSPRDGFLLRVEQGETGKKISEVFISAGDLRQLPSDTVISRSKPVTPLYTWIGPKLLTVFESEKVPRQKIQKVTVSSSDGYMSVLTGDLLSGLDSALCALNIAEEHSFPENYGYMRLIYPGLRAMYWVNEPNKIVVTLGETAKQANRFTLYFMDNAKFQEKMHKGDELTYIAVSDLLRLANMRLTRFRVLARDELFREYAVNNVIRYMILREEKEGTWKIEGVNVPTGLKTKEIFFIAGEDSGIILKDLNEREKSLLDTHMLFALIKNESVEITLGKSDAAVKKITPDEQSLAAAILTMREKHNNVSHITLKW